MSDRTWRWRRAAVLCAVAGVLASTQPRVAAQEPGAEPAVWRVVTKDSPPFAFRDEGRWRGLSIEIGEEIARELGVVMEVQETATVEAMLQVLEAGGADAALAAITVTGEREQRVDFSHPYYKTGLGVAVRLAETGMLSGVLRAVTSAAFLELVGLVLLALAGTGYLFWLLERKRNSMFQEGTRGDGISFGVWWSTIILFGHKGIFPKTAIGRLLAASGMLLSILLLSVLTGAIASILTVSQLESAIRDATDLRHMRTVTVAGTASEDFLVRRFLPHRVVATPREGLRAVATGEADALLFDAPILRHLVRTEFDDALRVLDRTFDEQDYAAAFPLGSPWRKSVNQAILTIRASREWQELVYRYLGR